MIKFKNLILEMISLPDIVYHGTVQDFDSFSTSKSNFRGTIYFTTDKNFAIEFAKDREGLKPIVYHCKLNINNVFDPEKQENLDLIKPIIAELVQEKYKDPITGVGFLIPNVIYLDGNEIKNPSLEQTVDWYIWRVKNGSWRILEGEKVLNVIKEKGFDALITKEGGAKNIAVFDPKKIQIIKKEYL